MARRRSTHPGLPISLQPEGDLLRIYDPDGRPIPLYFENADRVTELEAEIAHLRGS